MVDADDATLKNRILQRGKDTGRFVDLQEAIEKRKKALSNIPKLKAHVDSMVVIANNDNKTEIESCYNQKLGEEYKLHIPLTTNSTMETLPAALLNAEVAILNRCTRLCSNYQKKKLPADISVHSLRNKTLDEKSVQDPSLEKGPAPKSLIGH
jgi:hypothetical protein